MILQVLIFCCFEPSICPCVYFHELLQC
uniref:Uncharacterized protein n=1 Tax=Arundo donax TaxID=35708 RepID=A0A0A8Y5J3_ARUDO